jgi:hypothetical protein
MAATSAGPRQARFRHASWFALRSPRRRRRLGPDTSLPKSRERARPLTRTVVMVVFETHPWPGVQTLRAAAMRGRKEWAFAVRGPAIRSGTARPCRGVRQTETAGA